MSVVTLLTICSQSLGQSDDGPEQQARAALDRFLVAFNSGDNAEVREQIHYPNVTHGPNRLVIAEQPQDFSIPYEANRAAGWARSRWDNVTTYFVSNEKVNFGVEFSRLNEQGEAFVSGYVFYVFTKKDGRWAMQYRAGDMAPERHAEADLAQASRDALRAIDYFFAAFNAGDTPALAYVHHVPQAAILFENNQFVQADTMISPLIRTDFDGLRSREDWVSSEYTDIAIRGITPDRVIFEMIFERTNRAGEVYMRVPALWVLTKVDGRWGVQFRSLMASTVSN